MPQVEILRRASGHRHEDDPIETTMDKEIKANIHITDFILGDGRSLSAGRSFDQGPLRPLIKRLLVLEFKNNAARKKVGFFFGI